MGPLFGKEEILGGSNHLYENCVNPSECPVHKDEYEKERQPASFTERVKQGLQTFKDKIIGPITDAFVGTGAEEEEKLEMKEEASKTEEKA